MASFIPLAIMDNMPPDFELPPVVPHQPQVPPDVDPPLHGIERLLEVVGFDNPAERFRITEAGLAGYEAFRHLTEMDIGDMAEEFSKKTVALGRINFGIGRIKRLIGLMHWIQDCFRSDDDPDSLRFDEQSLAEDRVEPSLEKQT
jgi:hypothetical protein